MCLFNHCLLLWSEVVECVLSWLAILLWLQKLLYIDRLFFFEDLHSRSFSWFFNSRTFKLKASEARFSFCHLFGKVALKLSLTSFSHRERGEEKKKTYFCKLFKWIGQKEPWKNWQSCGSLIYCKLCRDKVSRFMLGSFILRVALKCFPIPFIVPRKIN